MSKSKKEDYAAKEKAASAAATARKLVLPTENAPMGKTAKKATTRKQSRGK
jgi:hypothetical protein